MDWITQMIPLGETDVNDMMTLQSRMLASLPDSRWYFPNTREEFEDDVRCGNAWGIRMSGKLVALGVACNGSIHPGGSYAAKLGRSMEGTFDFRDVMVDPDYRRQGIHSAFLNFFRKKALEEHCTVMYATVDPKNVPSRTSFEKAGFQAMATMPAYDGRIRTYYMWHL